MQFDDTQSNTSTREMLETIQKIQITADKRIHDRKRRNNRDEELKKLKLGMTTTVKVD